MRAESLKLGAGIYTVTDAAEILRLPKSKVSYWFRSYIKNKLEDLSGFRYYYDLGNNQVAVNFKSLIELKVFYELKNHNVKTNDILKAHKSIGEALGTPYPFASAKLLVSPTGRLYFEDEHQALLEANQHLQYVIEKWIRPWSDKITFGEDDMAAKYHPLGKKKKVVVNPENQFGSPIVEGTNILTNTIHQLHRGGDSIELIAKLYDISTQHVKDAIAFSKAA